LQFVPSCGDHDADVGNMLGDGPDRAEREATMVADTPMRRVDETNEVPALTMMPASD
jgi:hypothetical protein